MTDKDFFKIMKHESKEYSEVFYEAFPYWIMSIYFPALSRDAIENAIEGLDHNDESIDGFFINDETKEIIFIQCKSCDSEKQLNACKKEWLSYLFDVPNKLQNHDYIDKHKNQRIKDIAAEYLIYKQKQYKTVFYFFHLGYLPAGNIEILNSYNTEKKGQSFYYYSFKEIQDQYKEYKSKIELTDPEFFDISLSYSKDVHVIDKKIGNHHTFISIITGDQIVKLREEYKYKLFDKNVRFNLGENKINKEIIDSALKNPDDFYFYNNGMTITCTSFKFRDNNNSVRVDHPQIINGAQTVDSIFAAYNSCYNRKKRETGDEAKARDIVINDFKKIKVLFRLIQSEKHDSDFAVSVIKYNNTQNSIQIRDFFSNNEEQIELQKQFSKYGYFYEIKRGERNYIKNEKHNNLGMKLNEFKFQNDKIDIEKLAGLYRAFIGEPSAKEVGAKYILNDNETYSRIFGNSSCEITDSKVKEMILAYNIFDLIESESQNYKKILQILMKYESDNSYFNQLSLLVRGSKIFGDVFKKLFIDHDTYLKRKEVINKQLRDYYCFTQGKYHIHACFRLVLEQCNYIQTLLDSQLFCDKIFIDEKMVKPWLPICLDKLLIPTFRKAYDEESLSIGAFYLRQKTFNNIRSLFEQLDIKENRVYGDLFPLYIN